MGVDQKGFWASFFGGAKEAGIITEASAEQAPAQAVATPPAAQQRTEPDPEVARLRAELTRVKAEQIQKDAAAFATAEIAAGHALPAEQEHIAALYARAAEIDQSQPRDDGQPSCVALVKAAYGNRPAHVLSKPLVEGTPKTPAKVLANAGTAEETDLAKADASAREYAEKRNGKKS